MFHTFDNVFEMQHFAAVVLFPTLKADFGGELGKEWALWLRLLRTEFEDGLAKVDAFGRECRRPLLEHLRFPFDPCKIFLVSFRLGYRTTIMKAAVGICEGDIEELHVKGALVKGPVTHAVWICSILCFKNGMLHRSVAVLIREIAWDNQNGGQQGGKRMLVATRNAIVTFCHR